MYPLSAISYNKLRNHVSNGYTIRWCSLSHKDEILVQLVKNKSTVLVIVDVETALRDWKVNKIIRNGEADTPFTNVGFAPKKADSFVTMRNATILGVNISGDCNPGAGKKYKRIEGCVCGYDIELNMQGQERGGFPLPSVFILSVALWCTCGYKRFISTMDIVDHNSISVTSQQEIISRTISEIRAHEPLWLVGWNCYSFDNTCLLYHAAPRDAVYFRKTKIGTASTVDYGYILDVPGVYNVDPFGFMQRSPGHAKKFSDLSLHGVALKMGTTLKTEMPDLYSISSPIEIMEYNMNDSAVAAEIWIKSGLIDQVPSMAVASGSHVYDCVKYMTSVTARCSFSTEALLINATIDWSECTDIRKYDGGLVLDPIKGLHDAVAVCDFSAMYPTIMIDGNISSETLDILEPDSHIYGDVWYDNNYIYVRLTDRVTRFCMATNGLQRSILIKYDTLRNNNKKTEPLYAQTLKVVSNSIYGATGYENSPMYSPSCSASVTAIGRWCLKLAIDTFEECGLIVIYGDTDSCFVKATMKTITEFSCSLTNHVNYALKTLKNKFQGTPFRSMNMCLESIHPRVLLLEKKKYCKLNTDLTVEYKGISIVRRDTLGICKKVCDTICKALLLLPLTDANTTIARLINDVVCMAIQNEFTHSDVSKVMKRNQKRCYVYMGSDGEEKVAPIEMSVNTVSDYDKTYVLNALRSEILRFTLPCGLGTLSDIITASHIDI